MPRAWTPHFCRACGSRHGVGQGRLLWPSASPTRSSPGWGTWSDSGGHCHGRGPSLWCGNLSGELQPALEAVSTAGLQTLSHRAPCVCGGGGSSGEPEQLPHGKDSQPRTPDSTPPQLLPRGTPPLEGRLGWSGSRLAEPGSPSQHPRPHRAETAYLTHLVVACQAPYGHCPCPGRPLPRGLGTRPVSPCPGRCPFL